MPKDSQKNAFFLGFLLGHFWYDHEPGAPIWSFKSFLAKNSSTTPNLKVCMRLVVSTFVLLANTLEILDWQQLGFKGRSLGLNICVFGT